MAIVGRRMVATKHSQRVLGQRWRQCWFEVEHHDLHATKGWKFVKRFKVPAKETDDGWVSAPAVQEYFEPADGIGSFRLGLGPSDEGRLMRGRTPAPTPVRLTVHDWFRREVFGRSKRISSMTADERQRANQAMEEYRRAQKNVR